MPIVYQIEPELTAAEFVDLLIRSTLAERRPVAEEAVIEQMLRGASLVVTAREAASGELLGVARSLTDFAYCTYLADLAVAESHQRQGIGKELMRRTHLQAGLRTTLILLAAPKAVDYYPHQGLTHHDSCWIIPPQTAAEGA